MGISKRYTTERNEKAPKEVEGSPRIWNKTFRLRQSGRTRLTKKYNTYGDDFVVDRIDLKRIVEELVSLEELTVSQDVDMVDDHNEECIDDRSQPEAESDDEQQQ